MFAYSSFVRYLPQRNAKQRVAPPPLAQAAGATSHSPLHTVHCRAHSSIRRGRPRLHLEWKEVALPSVEDDVGKGFFGKSKLEKQEEARDEARRQERHRLDEARRQERHRLA